MSRDLETIVQAALSAGVVSPFFALDLMFDEDPLYLWTGMGSTTIGGKEYTGVRSMMNLSKIQESSDVSARGMSITLSGVPSEIISLALAEPYQGRDCAVYFGVMDDTSVYSEIFSGFMDVMDINEDPNHPIIMLKAENRLIELERPRNRRYTGAYQKSVYPGDLGLDFVEQLQGKQILWGVKEEE